MVEGDGSRAVQVLPYKNFSHGAIQVGYLNSISSCVRPIDLPPDGIHCQTISRHQPYREKCDMESQCFNYLVKQYYTLRQFLSPVEIMSSCADPLMLDLLIFFRVLSDQ